MFSFTLSVIKIIRRISMDRILTNRAITRTAGNPLETCRAGCIIHPSGRKQKLLRRRMINSRGRISLKEEGLLGIEGVAATGDKTGLSLFPR